MTDPAQRWQIQPSHFWLYGKEPESIVGFDENMGTWNVYGYRESLQVLTDPGLFSSDTARLLPMNGGDSSTEGDLLQTDPPQHRELRNLVSHAFTPKMVADLEARISQVTDELVAALPADGGFDAMAGLAFPLPVTVVAELLDIPAADRGTLEHWMDAMSDSNGELSLLENAEDQAKAFEEIMGYMQQLVDYLHEHVAQRRTRYKDDLLGTMLEAEVDGARLSDQHVVNFAKMLLIAGYLTTAATIGNTLLCLDAWPEMAAKVRADRSMVPGLIEESMRFLSPIAATYRATKRDTVLAGTAIPAEQMVLIWYGAANRDERQFAAPHSFDPTRDPNPHLGFGRGPHFCLGAPLARLEARIALNALFDRFGELRVAPDGAPRFMPAFDTTGVGYLPLIGAD